MQAKHLQVSDSGNDIYKIKSFTGYNMKFEDVKEQILKKITNPKDFHINEPVSLIDGFFNQSLTTDMNEVKIGGTAVPTIMLLGASGRIYFLAFKVLGIK